MKKIKQTVFSLVLAAAMVFASACSAGEQGSNAVQDTSAEAESVQSAADTGSDTSAEEVTEAEAEESTADNSSEAVSDAETEGKITTPEAEAKTEAPVSQSASSSEGVITSSEAATPAIVTTAATAAETTTSAPKESVPTSSGSFQVNGTKLYDANGNEFIMRGVNHAHAWYSDKLATALDGIAKTGANCVRVVLADGEKWNKTSADSVKKIIEECESRKLVAILEVHDATFGSAGDDFEALDKAADYWVEMKDIVNSHTDTVIVNIANEWHNGSWRKSKDWADGYKKVIPKLRNAGIKNTLMVDCDGNGQYPQSLFDYAEEIFETDTLKNSMFSIHMYEYAGADQKTIKSSIDKVLNMNLCLVIGEFGFKHTNGDVDEKYIMKYCTEKNVGYMGWSWKGNSGGVEYLDIATEWDGSSLSTDWGEILVNDPNGIKATSKTCTVFE